MNTELPVIQTIDLQETSSEVSPSDYASPKMEVSLDDFLTPQMLLAELLSRITPENCHPEISSGFPVGEEIW
jgi:hypothetical protein